MNLFAVRTTGDQQPVGFFWVDSKEALRSLVDAVADVDECEYRLMTGSAAIVWSDDEDWKMGVDERAENEIDPEERGSKVMEGADFEDTRGGFSDYVSGLLDVDGWVRLDGLPEDFAASNVERVLATGDSPKEESEDQSNVVLNPAVITEPTIRAAKIITDAFQQFITEEKRRLGENAPALPGIVALGNAVGAGLGALILSHGINGKNAREALETILSLTKSEGESLLEWSDKTKAQG